MKRTINVLIFAMLIFGFRISNAQIIHVDFTGSVTTVGSDLQGDSVDIGSPVTGSFVYDTNETNPTSFMLQIGNGGFSVAMNSGQLFVQNDQQNGSATKPADAFWIRGTSISSTLLNGHVADNGAMQFGLRKENEDGQLWDDNDLPDLADWANITLTDINAPDWHWLDFGLANSGVFDDQIRWEITSFNVYSDSLVKEIVSGDVIVPVKATETTEYQWKVVYNGLDSNVVIIDSVPAESDVMEINEDSTNLPLSCGGAASFNDASGLIDVSKGGKSGKKCKSATHLKWLPSSNNQELLVTVDMRESPGKGHKEGTVYAPTSCGPLYLNNGAKAYELDIDTGLPKVDSETGETLLPVYESNSLCVAAVRDPTQFGLEADNDGDGIYDFDEACVNEIVTDPCNSDTDGDTLLDGVDNCPLVPNTDQANIVNPGTVSGDACEDSDQDTVMDSVDSCSFEGMPVNEGDTLGADGCIIYAQ